MSQKVLLNAKEVNIILHRLACQLIENHNNFSDTVLIGLQPRGTYLANRLSTILKEDYNDQEYTFRIFGYYILSETILDVEIKYFRS